MKPSWEEGDEDGAVVGGQSVVSSQSSTVLLACVYGVGVCMPARPLFAPFLEALKDILHDSCELLSRLIRPLADARRSSSDLRAASGYPCTTRDIASGRSC